MIWNINKVKYKKSRGGALSRYETQRKREKIDLLGSGVWRAYFLPFKMFMSASPSSPLTFCLVWALFQSLFFVLARLWSKDAVAGRNSVRKVSPSDQRSNPGGGGSYSSIAAGLSPGDGGLLSSVAARLCRSDGEAHTALPSPAFVSECWRLSKLCAVGLVPVLVLGF